MDALNVAVLDLDLYGVLKTWVHRPTPPTILPGLSDFSIFFSLRYAEHPQP